MILQDSEILLYHWLFKVKQQFMAHSQQENKNHVPWCARAEYILLLFCDHQETDYESCEMDRGVAGPIFIQKDIKVSLGQGYLYSTRWESNIVTILQFFGNRSISLLSCVHQDTESE